MIEWVIGIGAFVYTVSLLQKVVRKYSGVTRWVFIEIIYNLVIKYYVGYLGLPSVFNYGSDLILLIIIYHYIHHSTSHQYDLINYKLPDRLSLLIALYFMLCIFSSIINKTSPILFLWAFRNNYRFFIILLICSSCLEESAFYDMSDILFSYLVINMPIIMYQSQVMSTGFGKSYGDYVSGLFSNGTSARGGNSSLNWLMCIVCTMDIVRYLNADQKLWHVLTSISLSLCMATVSEIKIFIFLLPAIALFFIIVVRKSFNALFITLFIICGIYVSTEVLYLLFPKFEGFFTFENIVAYATPESGYTHSGAINRLGSVRYIIDKFLPGPTAIMFGIGFGNAEYSSRFSLLTSEFYLQHSDTAYQWFSVSMILIETGMMGLLFYCLMALDIVRVALKKGYYHMREQILLQFSLVLVILAVLSAISNQSLRLETMGYTVWMFLSIPYVVARGRRMTDDPKVVSGAYGVRRKAS